MSDHSYTRPDDLDEIQTETIDLSGVETWEDFARKYDRACRKLPSRGRREVMQFEDELLIYVIP